MELQILYDRLEKPYAPGDIVRLNLVYQRIYGSLTDEEKRLAEYYVDQLIESPKKRILPPDRVGAH
ncbi:MAG: hypothetical protein PHE55_00320 [Methylococcaceae bacterium]|nr:hypothetical protein [Methylococcaceae bacterium]